MEEVPAKRGPHRHAGIVAVGVAAVLAWTLYRGATRPNRVLTVPGAVTGMTFSPGGLRLIVGGSRQAYAWDTTTWKSVEASSSDAASPSESPALSPDRSLYAEASVDSISLRETTTKRLVRELRVPKDRRSVPKFLDLSRCWLAAAYSNAQRTEIFLWDVSR